MRLCVACSALQPKEVLPDLRNFCASNGIQLLELDVGENQVRAAAYCHVRWCVCAHQEPNDDLFVIVKHQEPFLTMDNALTAEAVAVATDESSQPCLLFCSTGKVLLSRLTTARVPEFCLTHLLRLSVRL